MKFTSAFSVVVLCAMAATVQSAAIANPVAAGTLDKRILEQCMNKTGVCVSSEACEGTGFDGKERHIGGLCDRPNP
ncbi:hypothetical protein FBU30_000962, partial [Linnemannia zychae]